MKVNPNTVVFALLGAAGLYALYKLTRLGAAAGEAAGKAVYSAESAWLQFKDPTPQLTQQAALSRDDYIRLGYMVKEYKPFPGCEGDTCYKYSITPKGQAYIDAMKKAGV